MSGAIFISVAGAGATSISREAFDDFVRTNELGNFIYGCFKRIATNAEIPGLKDKVQLLSPSPSPRRPLGPGQLLGFFLTPCWNLERTCIQSLASFRRLTNLDQIN